MCKVSCFDKQRFQLQQRPPLKLYVKESYDENAGGDGNDDFVMSNKYDNEERCDRFQHDLL